MRHLVLAFLAVVASWQAHTSELQPYAMPRTEVLPIVDDVMERQYELYVKLPESYAENPDKHYPVIYTTDAQWHMDMLSGATEYLMPDVIVVGISWQLGLEDERLFISRFRDYTLTPLADPERQAQYQFGNAGQHLAFVRDTVIPAVDARYRTEAGRRAYFGYSLGAIFGAYTMLAAPDTFAYYILGSPALGQESLNHLRALGEQAQKAKYTGLAGVFVSIGELETSEMPITETFFLNVSDHLGENVSIKGLEIIDGSDHGTAFPETALRSIKWLANSLQKTDGSD